MSVDTLEPPTEVTPDIRNSIAAAFDTAVSEAESMGKKIDFKTPEPIQEEKVEQKAINEPEKPVEAVEQKEETTDTSDIPEGDAATPKAKAKWGEVKGKATQYDKILPEYERLKAENEELKSGKGIPEYEEVKKKASEYEKRQEEFARREEEVEKRQALIDATQTKAYSKAVKEPFQRLLADAESVAKDNNIDPDTLIDAVISKNKGKVQELIGELNEFDRGQVWDLVRNLQTIERAKADIENNAVGAREAAIREEREASERSVKEILNKRGQEFDKLKPVFESLVKDFPEEARPIFDTIRSTALSIETLPDNHKVYAAMAGTILPQIVESYKAQATELEELRKENSSLRNGSPRADGGKSPAAPAETKVEKNITDEAGLAEHMFAKLKNLG